MKLAPLWFAVAFEAVATESSMRLGQERLATARWAKEQHAHRHREASDSEPISKYFKDLSLFSQGTNAFPCHFDRRRCKRLGPAHARLNGLPQSSC